MDVDPEDINLFFNTTALRTSTYLTILTTFSSAQ